MERKQQQSLNEAIRNVVEGKKNAEDKFELGTPAIYKDGGKEYNGEVVMNPKNQRVKVNGQWRMIGKGALKGILTKNKVFIVPDDWKNVRSYYTE